MRLIHTAHRPQPTPEAEANANAGSDAEEPVKGGSPDSDADLAPPAQGPSVNGESDSPDERQQAAMPWAAATRGQSKRKSRDPNLEALLEFARRVNAYRRRLRDREDVHGTPDVRIGIVEALARRRDSAKGKGEVEAAARLAVDDPAGELVLRLLEPAGVDETTGELQFLLPHRCERNPNDRWTTANLVQIVSVTAGPDRRDGSIVKLDEESTKDLKSYCTAHNWRLDDGELESGAGGSNAKRQRTASTKGIPAPRKGADTGLEKQRRPRQQKVQTRVQSDTLQAVDAAVGLPERKSLFGRRLKDVQRGDFVCS